VKLHAFLTPEADEVSSRIRARKQFSVPIAYETGWTADIILTQQRREQSPASDGNQTIVLQLVLSYLGS
jgi:hypothetical protein